MRTPPEVESAETLRLSNRHISWHPDVAKTFARATLAV
jgi:hypothetical protein